jgi:hypothetical protein
MIIQKSKKIAAIGKNPIHKAKDTIRIQQQKEDEKFRNTLKILHKVFFEPNTTAIEAKQL